MKNRRPSCVTVFGSCSATLTVGEPVGDVSGSANHDFRTSVTGIFGEIDASKKVGVREVGVGKVVVLASNSPRIKSSSRQIVMYCWALGANGHFGQMKRVWDKRACAHLPQCPLVLLSLSVLNLFICISVVTIFLLILSPISLFGLIFGPRSAS